MIDPKLLRTDPHAVAKNLARRGFALDVAALAAIEERRKAVQIRTDALRNERNTRSKAIGIAKGRGEDVAPLLKEVEHLGVELAASEASFAATQTEVEALALTLQKPLLVAELRQGRAVRLRKRGSELHRLPAASPNPSAKPSLSLPHPVPQLPAGGHAVCGAHLCV